MKHKPTSIKNPQANAILERMHQVIMTMLRAAELDMANTVAPSDIADFLTDAAWDMLFDIPYLADWNKIGDHRQRQTNRNTERENKSRVDWDYKVDDRVLLCKEGILCKSESKYHKDPWTISTSIRMVQSGFTAEQTQKD
eukprot:CCRYP_015299-RA/>CCRYP_015299-RA protein AED:0.44 eAED:0.44 QI:0/0/0/1/0/0/2/0/139